MNLYNYTDAEISLHTLLVKYYNDLLGRQTSERGWDEVTYFSVGDLFCTHLGTKYANFQEKIFAEISVTSSLSRSELCLPSKSL